MSFINSVSGIDRPRGLSARLLIGSAVAAALGQCLFGAPQALAQDARAESQLEEIVVTARKREESLLEVPIAITAVSEQTIEDYNLKDLNDLQRITPGFQLTETGFRRSRENFNLVFRGLNVGQATGLQAAATIFIDGAPYIGGRPSSYQDVERIEVLKGPQAAYFGRATYSGAINLITRSPSKDGRATISAEIGQFGSTDAMVSFEGPVMGEKLTGRVTLRNIVKGAQHAEKIFNAPVGERKTQLGSVSLEYNPTEKLRVKVFGEYSEFHDSMSMVWDFPMNEFANCNPTGAATKTWICGKPPSIDIALSRLGFPAVTDARFNSTIVPLSIYKKLLLDPGDNLFVAGTATHVIADYSFDNGMTLSAIGAYHNMKVQSLEESTQDAKFGFYPCPLAAGCGRPFGQYIFLIDQNKHDRYAELRLTSDQESRLRWIVGASYISASFRSVSGGEIPTTAPTVFGLENRNVIETVGLFGGVNFDVTDQLSLAVEGRYQTDDVFLDPNRRSATPLGISEKFTSTSPRVSVQYQATPELMVYGSYSKGTRPGTFNGALLSRPQFVIDILQNQYGVKLPVEEEELAQFELGLKGRFLDNRLQATVAVYKGELTNQQIAQSIFVNTPQLTTTIGFTNNAGQTDIQGVEVEASALLTERLRLDFGFALSDTEIVKDNCAQCVRIGSTLTASQGKKVDGTPLNSGYLTGTYTVPLDTDRDWYARAEYSYTGKMYGDRLNLSYNDAANVVNLRTGLRTAKYDLEAFLVNAFDDDTYQNIALNTDLPSFGVALKVGLPDRRQWGIRGTYRF